MFMIKSLETRNLTSTTDISEKSTDLINQFRFLPLKFLTSPKFRKMLKSHQQRNWLPIEDKHRMLFVYSFFPQMNILELTAKDGDQVVPFRQIETSDSLDNIFVDIANESNMTIDDAKKTIAIHGSSPILAVKNVLLGRCYLIAVFTRTVLR